MGGSTRQRQTLSQQHFLEGEVFDTETFLHFEKALERGQQRLAHGLLTVLSTPPLDTKALQAVRKLAKSQQVSCVALVLDRVWSQQGLRAEGFKRLFLLAGIAPQSLNVVREPLWSDRKHLKGPFDFIGDVHGCATELKQLLSMLGYERPQHQLYWSHPSGRKAFFVGDLIDRGPQNLEALFLARDMVNADQAFCLEGNHEAKFLRYLMGKNVQRTHGFEQTVAEIEALSPAEQARVKSEAKTFIEGLFPYATLDGGKLLVAHAGLKASYHGRVSGRVRSFALYGDTTGKNDAYGLPERRDWAAEYDDKKGKPLVVYGHVPVKQAAFVNNTLDIDTGCVFGGHLTALRYPEREIFSVPAQATYYEHPQWESPLS
jgi:protein phosphatase